MRGLKGRVALVSGAAGPMGFAIAERLAAEGARLLLTDISGTRLDAAEARLRAEGARVEALRADVTQRAKALAVVAHGVGPLGPIDVLGGEGGQADYAAAKAGVAAFTRSLAREFAPAVRVNCVAPGLIQTSVTDRIDTELRDELVSRAFMARAGLSSEVAATVAFLASDEAWFLTGEVVAVSGGNHPHL